MRFVSTTPKYSAYYKQNILFGYVVKSINITKNTSKINTLQNSLLNEISSTGFVLEQSDDSLFYVYSCNYDLKSIGSVTLKHLFINFSNVIKTNTDVSHAS